MSAETLSPDEVERIAREFARERWGAEVIEIRSVWPSPKDESIVEVEGRAKKHVQVLEAGKCIDNIVEYPFKLQISAKDSKVKHFWEEEPNCPYPAPPSSQDESVIPPEELFTCEDIGRDEQLDRDLRESEIGRNRAEADYYKERTKGGRQERDRSFDSLSKKYGLDPTRFRIDIDS